MDKRFPAPYKLHPQVAQALQRGAPVVALESTVITHGLPLPKNLELAMALEDVVKKNACPATIALMAGKIIIGLTGDQLKSLANGDRNHKISARDLSLAVSAGWTGGTTVSATLKAAHQVGIKVFATGGIGGVHRGSGFDISADLIALANTPLIVVCSGAKAILDLPATREKLETYGIPVIGYQTDEFPAFYSQRSGLPVDYLAEDIETIASVAKSHWILGMQSAILVVNPPPAETSLAFSEIEPVIQQALMEANERKISGSAITPFLLDRVSTLSKGKSLESNLALLKSNANLAAQIAVHIYTDPRTHRV